MVTSIPARLAGLAVGCLTLLVAPTGNTCIPSFETPVFTYGDFAISTASCANGDGAACRGAYHMGLSLAGVDDAFSSPRPEGLLVRACQLRDASACVTLQRRTWTLPANAAGVLGDACSGGDLEACQGVLRAGVKRFTKAELQAARVQACALGSSAACRELGAPQPKPDPNSRPRRERTAAEVAAACAKGDPNSCAFVETRATGKALRALRRRTARPLKRGCRAGNAAHCLCVWALYGAHPCSRHKLTRAELATGRRHLTRACALGLYSVECDPAYRAEMDWDPSQE